MDHLTRAKLMAFRETLVRERKRIAHKGGKRGKRAKRERSPSRHSYTQPTARSLPCTAS